jgi:ATP adenylyltransferase
MDYLWTPWRYRYVTGTDHAEQRVGVPPALAAWPGDRKCVFCNLHTSAEFAAQSGMDAVEADRAAHIVKRGRHCFVCLNAFPYSSGHVMVIPYAHQQSLAALAEDAALEMMQLARQTESVLRAVYAPHGINLGMNLGKAAGAGVDEHLHLHALPRWLGDTNFMTVTAETRVLPESLDVSWERLHAAFVDNAIYPPTDGQPQSS